MLHRSLFAYSKNLWPDRYVTCTKVRKYYCLFHQMVPSSFRMFLECSIKTLVDCSLLHVRIHFVKSLFQKKKIVIYKENHQWSLIKWKRVNLWNTNRLNSLTTKYSNNHYPLKVKWLASFYKICFDHNLPILPPVLALFSGFAWSYGHSSEISIYCIEPYRYGLYTRCWYCTIPSASHCSYFHEWKNTIWLQ